MPAGTLLMYRAAAQGCFPSNHPLNHSPASSAWAQLSGLAVAHQAVLSGRQKTELCVYCDLYAAEYWEDIEEAQLAPSGDKLAVITPHTPRFSHCLSGCKGELPRGARTFDSYSGSTGAWSEPSPA